MAFGTPHQTRPGSHRPVRLVRNDSGNVFAMLFAAVALTGVLASVGMQTLTGPVTTITRVTQKNIADNNLLMNGKIIVNAAVTGAAGGDPDSDGIIEPAAFVAPGGGEQAPDGGGFLPLSLGLALTDPWGSRFGYCVWDHGTVNSSSGRITGDNTTTASTQPVIAIIAAGPDKLFQTSCTAYSGGPVAVAKPSGSDDLVFRYTYAEATASSNGLWTLNPTDQTQAQLKDASGVANVTIDRSTGLGRFFGIVTDTLAAATSILTVDGGLKLDTQANVTTCGAGEAGVVRYNAVTSKLEVCTGTVWKPAGSSEATYITRTPSDDLDSEQALSLLNTGVLKVTSGTGTVSSGAVDLAGAEATGILAAGRFPALTGEVTTIEGSLTTTVADDILDFSELKDGLTLDATTDIALDGEKVLSITNTGTGASFLVRDDAGDLTPFVIDATGRVGIGTASPEVTLDVAGSARLLAGGALEFGGIDTLIRGNAGTNVMTFFTGGSERMRISPQGNVGIGDVDPNAKLVVAGGLRIGTHTECLGAANNGTIRYDTVSKKMQLCVDGAWSSVSGIERLDDIGDVEAPAPADNDILAWNATENRWESKNINAVGPAQVTVAGANGSIQFKAGSDLAADAAHLHYDDASNRLGVGTNVPAETIDVAGTARISGHLALGSTAAIVSRLVVGSTALWADDASRRVGVGTATPVATLDVAGGIRLADDAATCTLAKEGTLRFAAGRLQFCYNNEWSDVGLVTGPGMGGPTPDAIDCGVSGTKRVLYLQSVTATHYVYGFIAAAQGLGLQITYDKAGNHVTTYNPSAWTGASACDGKTMAQLGAEGRIYYLSGGPGGQQSGLAYGPDGYVQFAAGGALSGASEFVWNNVDKRLGIRVATPVTALDVAGGIKIGTDSQCGTSPSKAGMLVWNANTLQVCTSAGTFLSIADAGGLAESDPQVSAVTAAKWCRGTGAAVTCDVDPISAGITALTGDVTATGPGSAVATITTGAVTTTKIADGTIVTADIANEAVTSDKIADGGVATDDLANSAVTLTKMADIASGRLLGRSTAGTGPVETISIGSGLVLSAGTLAAGNIDGSRITADTLDFTEFKDAMTLDASTDIAATGTNVLSVTNTGTGNSFVVNDQASDTTPFVVDASGNVGIGTTAPQVPLSVIGDSRFNTPGIGTAGQVVIDAPSSNGRIYAYNASAALQVMLRSQGDSYLTGGNVGIGSTSPAQRLSVSGNISVTSAGDWIGYDLNSNIAFTGGAFQVQFPTVSPLTFVSSSGSTDVERMRIDTSGRLGIGTASPRSLLHVAGGIQLGGDSDACPGTSNAKVGTIRFVADLLELCKTTGWDVASGGLTGAAGLDKQVQFNDAGALAGASQLIWDKATNRLGIGSTASPTQPLDVTGAVTSNSILLKIVASAAAPITGASYWSSDGTNVWRANGNVGIGETAPNARLVVAGGARVGADALCNDAKAGTIAWNASTLQVCVSTAVGFVTVATASGVGATAAGTVAGAVQFRGATAVLAADDSNFVWDNTNKRLGIGTSNPQRQLELAGTTAGSSAVLRLNKSDSNAAAVIAYAEFGGSGADWARTGWVGDGNSTEQVISLFGDAGSDLRLGANGAEAVRILSSNGNVGIGTIEPLARLMVVDETNQGWRYEQYNDADGTNYRNYRARGTKATPSAVLSGDRLASFLGAGYGATQFSAPNGGVNVFAAENFTDTAAGTYVTLSTAELGTNPAGGGIERVRIASNGNVGIGTALPLHSREPGRRYLSVRGTTDAGMIELSNTLNDADGATIGGIQFSSSSYSNSANGVRGAAIMGRQDGSTASDRGGRLEFHTKNDGGLLVERIRIDSSGNVGIGTTSPISLLQVANPGNSGTTKDNASLYVTSTNRNSFIQLDAPTSRSGSLVFSSGLTERGRIYYDNTANFLTFNTNAEGIANAGERMRIDRSGNIGIGTTSPRNTLHILSAIPASTSNDHPYRSGAVIEGDQATFGGRLTLRQAGFGAGVMQYRNNGTISSPTPLSSGDFIGSFGFGGFDGSVINGTAYLSAVATEPWSTTAHGTALALYTTSNGSGIFGGVERVRIDHNGNVGIGTTTPLSKLTVGGSSGIVAAEGTDYPSLYIVNTSKASGAFGRTWAWMNYGAGLYLNTYASTAASHDPGGPIVSLFASDSTGNIGIGNSTPGSTKLYVTQDNSGPAIYGYNTGSNYGVRAHSVSSYGIYSTSAANYGIVGQSTQAGYGGVLGYSQDSLTYGILGHANIYGVFGYHNSSTAGGIGVYGRSTKSNGYGFLGYNDTAAYHCYIGYGNSYSIACSGPTSGVSDERLKKDIVPLSASEGLDAIMKIQPVHYHWKDEKRIKREIGFLAQDVEEVLPELVGRLEQSDPNDPKSLKDVRALQYDRLAAPIVKALQQLKSLFDGHDHRIVELEAAKADLTKRLSTLEETHARTTADLEARIETLTRRLEAIEEAR